MRLFMLTVLFVVTHQVAYSSLVTSTEKVRDLALGRDGILRVAIERAIKAQLQKVEELTRFLVHHANIGSQSADNMNLNHPNDIYRFIRGYISTWSEDKATNEELSSYLFRDNIVLPTPEDLTEARVALLMLQRVYKLDVHLMFRGNYSGYLGSPLEMEDAYELGKDAFISGFPREAVDWLRLYLQQLEKGPLPEEWDHHHHLVARMKALALMGRALFYINETTSASEVLKTCSTYEDSDIGDIRALALELESGQADRLRANFKKADKSYEDSVFPLCNRPKQKRVAVLRPFHVCRFKPDVRIPYLRYKEEILSVSPFVSLIHEIISESEIQYVKSTAKTSLSRGSVMTGKNQFGSSRQRTGQVAWLTDTTKEIIGLSRRVKSVTRLEVFKARGRPKSAESLQVVNYGLGGHYDAHLDAFEEERDAGHRIATFLFYCTLYDADIRKKLITTKLSDVEKGGSTVFPRVGLSVAPVKGMALMWYNFEPDMRHPDRRTLHASCPVVIGNKWISNKWIWTYGNTFRRPCGLTSYDTQLDIENLLSSKQPPPVKCHQTPTREVSSAHSPATCRPNTHP